MQHIMGIGGVYTGFWWGNLRERDHLEDSGIHDRIILRWNFRNLDVGGRDWIYLAWDRDRRQARVNAVTNFQVT
jgi:hypothetical protein